MFGCGVRRGDPNLNGGHAPLNSHTWGVSVSGQFDVVTAELTSAAAKIRSAVAPVAFYTLSSAGASAAAFGHDQLAEVFVEFCTKAGQVVSGAATGDEQAAGSLDTSAATYDAVDQGSGVLLGGLSPLSPTATVASGR